MENIKFILKKLVSWLVSSLVSWLVSYFFSQLSSDFATRLCITLAYEKDIRLDRALTITSVSTHHITTLLTP